MNSPIAGLDALESGAIHTLPNLLKARVARVGNAPLFSDRSANWGGADVLQIAATRAGALSAAGITRGERVALFCSNRAEFLEIVLGCAWLGAIVVPINTASRGMQLSHIFKNSGARLLVTESKFVEAIAALDSADLALEQIWLVDYDAAVNVALPSQAMSAMPSPGDAIEPCDLSNGDPLAILYTSGTSGLSKGVICPHAQFYWFAKLTWDHLSTVAGDVFYTCLPLFHINALNTFVHALISDASMVVDRKFSASGFFDALVETKANVTYLLGAMVPILLSRPESQAERSHTVRVALAPGVPARFQEEFTRRTGIGIVDGYASTETNFMICSGVGGQRPGFMGKLVEGYHARVVDSLDQPVPDGIAGELLLRADEPFAFASGYHGMPDKTVEAWRNLWFHTGDRVVREPDGYFRFVDRLKDAIRRRGENISSFEVEQVVSSHPAIETVAVYAVNSELAEDEVMAAIILREDMALEPLDLIRYCEPRLPYFAIPRFIEFVSELPKTENGKVQKYKLRERGVSDSTWDLQTTGYRVKR